MIPHCRVHRLDPHTETLHALLQLDRIPSGSGRPPEHRTALFQRINLLAVRIHFHALMYAKKCQFRKLRLHLIAVEIILPDIFTHFHHAIGLQFDSSGILRKACILFTCKRKAQRHQNKSDDKQHSINDRY